MQRPFEFFRVAPRIIPEFPSLRGLGIALALISGLCPASPSSASPGLAISEVLADPTFASDAAVEYIELCATGSESLNLRNHVLRVDGKPFPLPDRVVASGHAFLLCRDTATAIAQGLPCRGSLPGLSLANGRTLMLELLSAGDTTIYIVNPGRPGEAQQNQSLGLPDPPFFQPSQQPYRGDFATPGLCWDTLAQTGRDAGPSNSPSLADLKNPRMSSSQLTLQSGETISMGFPPAYAGGTLRILAAEGEEVFTQRLPEGGAPVEWDGRDQGQAWVKPGPYVIIATSRGKVWRRACLVAHP